MLWGIFHLSLLVPMKQLASLRVNISEESTRLSHWCLPTIWRMLRVDAWVSLNMFWRLLLWGGWGGNECPTEFHDGKKHKPKTTPAFCRQMALYFLQITAHIWLLVPATTLTTLETATHSWSEPPWLFGDWTSYGYSGRKGITDTIQPWVITRRGEMQTYTHRSLRNKL